MLVVVHLFLLYLPLYPFKYLITLTLHTSSFQPLKDLNLHQEPEARILYCSHLDDVIEVKYLPNPQVASFYLELKRLSLDVLDLFVALG